MIKLFELFFKTETNLKKFTRPHNFQHEFWINRQTTDLIERRNSCNLHKAFSVH